MKFDKLSKYYGNTAALKELTAEIGEGEITAVLGESGAGKTTFLNALAGLITFDGHVDGLDGKKPKPRKSCSYLFQDCKLLPNLTAEGNLKLVLNKSEWGKIPDMLSRVGLKGREGAYPNELSGGEKQRVAIARAFLYPHDILLMDEPFSSLDLGLKRSLIGLVTELWQETKSTIVFVTHDVREAVLLSGRALVLRKGELVFDIKIDAPYPREFLSPPAQERALVEELLSHH